MMLLTIGFALFWIATVIALLWWHEREQNRMLDQITGPIEPDPHGLE